MFLLVDCPSLLVDCFWCVTAAVIVVLATATTTAVVVIAVVVSSGIHQSWAVVARIGVDAERDIAMLGNNATKGGILAKWRGIITDHSVVAELGVVAKHEVIVTERVVVTELGVVAERCGVVAERGIVITEHGVVVELGVVADRRGIVAERGVIFSKRAPSSMMLSPRLALSPEHGVQ